MSTITGVTPVAVGVRQALNLITGAAPLPPDSLEHPYWRIRITSPGEDVNYSSIAEIELFAEDDLSTTATEYHTSITAEGVIDASSYFSTSYEPYEAFNGATSSDGWMAATGDITGWISYYFDTPKHIVGARLYWYGYYGDDTIPTAVALEYSDNAVDWVVKKAYELLPEERTRGEITTFAIDGVTIGETVDVDTYYGGGIELQPYSALGRIDPQNQHTLPAFTGDGTILSGDTGEGGVELPSFTGEGGGIVGSISSGEATLPGFVADAAIVPDSTSSLPAYVADGEGYAGKIFSGAGELPSFTASAAGLTENVASGSSTIPVYEIAAQATAIGLASADITLTKIALSASGYAGTIATVAVEVPAYELDAAGHGEYVGTVAVTLPMLQLEATTAPVEALTGAYALNLSMRGLTQFDAFGYNSFATFNGVTLAAGPNGIFAVGGETDDGSAIDASFAVHGKAQTLQRMIQAVVNYRTDGEMLLRVTPEEGDDIYEYALIKSDTTLSKGRTKLGRGIKTSNVQFEFSNVNGSDFEIDYIDIDVIPTSRRMK